MTDTEFSELFDTKMELTEDAEYRGSRDNLTNDKAIAKAAEQGLEVVFPDEHTITIDIDSAVLPTQYHTQYDLLREYYEVLEETIKSSKSGNLHVYLKMKDAFTDTEKLVIQAALGSDPKRELLGLVRAKEKIDRPSLMFEKPAVPEEVAF